MFDEEPQPGAFPELGAEATCDDSCVGEVVGGWLANAGVVVDALGDDVDCFSA